MNHLKKISVLLLLSLSLLLTACNSEKEENKPVPQDTNVKAQPEAEAQPNIEVKPDAEAQSNEPNETEKKEDIQPKEDTAKADMKVYNGDGFSLSYPSSWEKITEELPDLEVGFIDSEGKYGLYDNVNVGVKAFPYDAKMIADELVKQYSSGAGGEVIKDFKLIKYTDRPLSENMKSAGVLKAEYIQGQAGIDVILNQFIVSDGSKIHITTLTFSKESYENGGEAIVQQIIDSFKLTGTP